MHGLTGGDWKRTGNSPAPRQSPTLLDQYWRRDLCRSRAVHGLGDRADRCRAGVRQMPQFRGLAGRMVPCWSDLLISIPIVLALARFRLERNQVDIVSLLSTGIE